jgi:hypothetical protein
VNGTYSRRHESNHRKQDDEELMEIDGNPIKEVLDDLFSLLEALETQNIAVLQFLKEQGIAPEDKLAPYLERAGAASSVKWRAARARMNFLLAPAPKKSSESSEKEHKERRDQETAPPGSKSEEAKPGDAKSPEGKSDGGKSGEVKSGGAKPNDAESQDTKNKDADRKDESAKASALKNIGPTDAEQKSDKSEPPKNDSRRAGKDATGSPKNDQEKAAKPATGDTETKKQRSRSAKPQ